MTQTPKPVVHWLYSAIILILLMIAIGGITRLTKSGLSMVEWHPVTGIVPPLTDTDWIEEFTKYQTSPEFKVYNHWMTIEDFKKIFFWEYLHRLVGRIIGFWFIIPFFVFHRKKFFSKKMYHRLSVMFVFGILQGLAGWYMVKSGLADIPHVSHYRLALHLILAFGLIGYIYWTILEVKNPKMFSNGSRLKILINLILGLSILQIIYGAFTAGLKAGFAWNTFPLMQNQLVPEGLFSLSPILNNFTTNIMTIQFIHRTTAWILLFLVFWLWKNLRDISVTDFQIRSNFYLLLLITTQFVLGVLTLIFSVPLSLAVLHQIVASLLLLSIINIKFLLKVY
jgi:cytochrome c oxidase assembly protein subunit 15